MSPTLTETVTTAATPPVRTRVSRPRRKGRARPGSLLAWRIARKINQREAADALGISQTYYSKLEREAMYARPKLAVRLRVLTGLSLETLLGVKL